MSARIIALLAAPVLLWTPCALHATDDSGYAKCRDIQDDRERLACFDGVDRARAAPQVSYLERHWRLADRRIDIDDVQVHRPNYILFGKWTNHANTEPSSPAPGHTVPAPIPWNDDELSFQLSFKAELVSRHDFDRKFLGLADARLWFAYTQQSFWQVYNPRLSRPFRETNYEPEVILTFGTGNQDDGAGDVGHEADRQVGD